MDRSPELRSRISYVTFFKCLTLSPQKLDISKPKFCRVTKISPVESCGSLDSNSLISHQFISKSFEFDNTADSAKGYVLDVLRCTNFLPFKTEISQRIFCLLTQTSQAARTRARYEIQHKSYTSCSELSLSC